MPAVLIQVSQEREVEPRVRSGSIRYEGTISGEDCNGCAWSGPITIDIIDDRSLRDE